MRRGDCRHFVCHQNDRALNARNGLTDRYQIENYRLLSAPVLEEVVLGNAGCVALFALAAFLAGDPKAAALSAMTASITFSFTYSAGKGARTKAFDSLREMGSRSRQFDGAAPEHPFHGPKAAGHEWQERIGTRTIPRSYCLQACRRIHGNGY
jgi:hypothetical protein